MIQFTMRSIRLLRITLLIGLVQPTLSAQEVFHESAADIMRQAAETIPAPEALFVVHQDIAGAIVYPNDVRYGLHQFDEQDIVSELLETHLLRCLLTFTVAMVCFFAFLPRVE